MAEIYVVYYSNTGNTEAMANYVVSGIEKKGKKAVLTEASKADPGLLKEAKSLAFGCPACGSEELDESIKGLIEEIAGSLEGKKVGLFGSYGWGEGEWMRDWEKEMADYGAKIATDEGIIAQEEPEAAKEALIAMGEELADD